jgi:hypothetical protein
MSYKQVGLKGTGIHSGSTTVAWIPKKYAEKDNTITITGTGNVIWRVDWVSTNTIGDAIYPDSLIREHRKNTGDALPK